MRTRWVWVAAVICGISAASLALPSVPTTDAWGWIVWGRELTEGELHTDVDGAPSWKPLPVVFTTLLALLGDGAPEGWLFVSRALGLSGLLLAYLVGKRLAGRFAGVAAAVALALAGGWVRGLEHGYSEPLVLSSLLGALLAYLEGRRQLSLWLVAASSLARPELWPLLLLMTLWLARAEPRLRARAFTALAAVPVLWVGVDWLGSGRFMNGSKTAAGVARDLSGLDVLALGLRIPPPPVLALASAAALIAAVRRERLPVTLAVAVMAWAGGLAAAVALGYPPTERLLLPLMAVVCVLAGVGAARLTEIGNSARARAALAGLLVAASLPFAIDRVDATADQVSRADERARLQLDLRYAASLTREDAFGADAVALPADLSWMRGAVAWEWHLPLRNVGVLQNPPPGARLFAFVPRSRPLPDAEPLVDTRGWRLLLDLRTSRAHARRGPG